MPIDRPDAAELVTAVREHLGEHVAPLLEGQPAFHLLVALNALAAAIRPKVYGSLTGGVMMSVVVTSARSSVSRYTPASSLVA